MTVMVPYFTPADVSSLAKPFKHLSPRAIVVLVFVSLIYFSAVISVRVSESTLLVTQNPTDLEPDV